MKGIIYILTNKYMPNIIKIGKTFRPDVQERMDELYRPTGVPYPFDLFYACEVENLDRVEKAIHNAFDDYRFNKKKEFFTIAPHKIKNLIKDLGLEIKEILLGESNDLEIKEIFKEEERKDRLPKFNFEKAGIKNGSTIIFEDESITAEVIDKTKIKCIIDNKEIIDNCSAIAQILLKRKKQPQGTLHWIFEGETLNQRWVRLLQE